MLHRQFIGKPSSRCATRAVAKVAFSAWQLLVFAFVAACLSTTAAAIGESDPVSNARITTRELGRQLMVGDVVFIRVAALPFKKVASATESWTNHVGIVIDVNGQEPVIGESTFPISKATPLSRFVARSEEGRVAVTRLTTPLTPKQQAAIAVSAQKRMRILYDTGFDLESPRQFCSRYVREVLDEATGIQLGDVEDFATLLARNPNADIAFWKTWYFGSIPWQRKTVTPASLLQSSGLRSVFDGVATTTLHLQPTDPQTLDSL